MESDTKIRDNNRDGFISDALKYRFCGRFQTILTWSKFSDSYLKKNCYNKYRDTMIWLAIITDLNVS